MGKKGNKKDKDITIVKETLVESHEDDEVDGINLNEETKAEPALIKEKTPEITILKKSNSKFKVGAESEEQKLYRPEFDGHGRQGTEKIWELMSSYIGNDQRSIQRSIINHVEYTLA